MGSYSQKYKKYLIYANKKGTFLTFLSKMPQNYQKYVTKGGFLLFTDERNEFCAELSSGYTELAGSEVFEFADALLRAGKDGGYLSV